MKPSTAPSNEDQFGHIVARALSANLEQMPYEVQERLRAARMRAVAARRVAPIWSPKPKPNTWAMGP